MNTINIQSLNLGTLPNNTFPIDDNRVYIYKRLNGLIYTYKNGNEFPVDNDGLINSVPIFEDLPKNLYPVHTPDSKHLFLCFINGILRAYDSDLNDMPINIGNDVVNELKDITTKAQQVTSDAIAAEILRESEFNNNEILREQIVGDVVINANIATTQANTARDAANAAANAGGTPKDSFNTLTDLQTAFPLGTTGIYLVTANGHWYSWKGGTWTDGGVYLSDITTDIYNVDQRNPYSGGGHYLISNAPNVIPIANRRKGLIITFQLVSLIWETYQFEGEIVDWTTVANWRRISNTSKIVQVMTGVITATVTTVTIPINTYFVLLELGKTLQTTSAITITPVNTGSNVMLINKTNVSDIIVVKQNLAATYLNNPNYYTFGLWNDGELFIYGTVKNKIDINTISNTLFQRKLSDTVLPTNSQTIEGAITEEFTSLSQIKSLISETVPVSMTISKTETNGYYAKTGGAFFASSGYDAYNLIPVLFGESYLISGQTRSSATALIVELNAVGGVVSYKFPGDGVTLVTHTDEVYNVSSNLVVNIGVSSVKDGIVTVKKQTLSNKAYTKSELNSKVNKKYGFKYDITNKLDLGLRTFDAVGLNATIGVGSTLGVSDFDNIYPWSEMKRCNINVTTNGAKLITFEGDTGFSLTGSNGDVFVRIPKFSVTKYKDGNFQNVVIEQNGNNTHPAFIENGIELSEIFVSAFEGAMYSGKYSSIAGLVPTVNILPQDLLNLATSRGSNYTLYDSRTIDLLYTLISVEFNCRNTSKIFGYGIADYVQADNLPSLVAQTTSLATNTIRISIASTHYKSCFAVGMGILICRNNDQYDVATYATVMSISDTTDGLYTDITFNGAPIDIINTTSFIGNAPQRTNWCESIDVAPLLSHTGRADKLIYTSVKNTMNPMRYRWIENLVGNAWHFIPDIAFNNLQMYVCDNIKDYVMFKIVPPYRPVSVLFPLQDNNGTTKSDLLNTHFWIDKLNNDHFLPSDIMGNSVNMNQLSTEGFGGHYYMYSGNRIIANGGGFDHLYRCNILTNRAWIANNNKWYLYGGRLIFK